MSPIIVGKTTLDDDVFYPRKPSLGDTSGKIRGDSSAYSTEMSGVSLPRPEFVKQINRANPAEIIEALSPKRRQDLLQALSASNSPVITAGVRQESPGSTRSTSPFVEVHGGEGSQPDRDNENANIEW
jgi:hypothetical protein